MTSTIVAQAASIAAAALFTLAVFSGADALAGHQYRYASSAQAQSQVQQAAVAVQRVTIVGHRTART